MKPNIKFKNVSHLIHPKLKDQRRDAMGIKVPFVMYYRNKYRYNPAFRELIHKLFDQVMSFFTAIGIVYWVTQLIYFTGDKIKSIAAAHTIAVMLMIGCFTFCGWMIHKIFKTQK